MGNIPADATDTAVKDLLEAAIRDASSKFQVLDARLIHDRNTNRFRGFGFVPILCPDEPRSLESLVETLAGLEMDGRDVRGRECRRKLEIRISTGRRVPVLEAIQRDREREAYQREVEAARARA